MEGWDNCKRSGAIDLHAWRTNFYLRTARFGGAFSVDSLRKQDHVYL